MLYLLHLLLSGCTNARNPRFTSITLKPCYPSHSFYILGSTLHANLLTHNHYKAANIIKLQIVKLQTGDQLFEKNGCWQNHQNIMTLYVDKHNLVYRNESIQRFKSRQSINYKWSSVSSFLESNLFETRKVEWIYFCALSESKGFATICFCKNNLNLQNLQNLFHTHFYALKVNILTWKDISSWFDFFIAVVHHEAFWMPLWTFFFNYS